MSGRRCGQPPMGVPQSPKFRGTSERGRCPHKAGMICSANAGLSTLGSPQKTSGTMSRMAAWLKSDAAKRFMPHLLLCNDISTYVLICQQTSSDKLSIPYPFPINPSPKWISRYNGDKSDANRRITPAHLPCYKSPPFRTRCGES